MRDDRECQKRDGFITWARERKRKVGCPRTTQKKTGEKERQELRWKTWTEAKVRTGEGALQPCGPRGPNRTGKVIRDANTIHYTKDKGKFLYSAASSP